MQELPPIFAPTTREIEAFLHAAPQEVGQLYNERALQLELGAFLRSRGFEVQFERPFRNDPLAGSTRRPKRDLDIIAVKQGSRTAIELKVPLAGRVPETMYDFCADIAFVEAIVRAGAADIGVCLLVTNDRQFWQGTAREGTIYNYFRDQNVALCGLINKPTGAKDTTISLSGRYNLGSQWKKADDRLMRGARYLLVEIC